jgi:hypothetical protein
MYHAQKFIDIKMCLVYSNEFVNNISLGCKYSNWEDVLKYCPDCLKQEDFSIPSNF